MNNHIFEYFYRSIDSILKKNIHMANYNCLN